MTHLTQKRILKMKRKDKVKILIKERRRFIRHPVCFPLTYKVIAKNTKLNSLEEKTATLNIGIGGLLFPVKKPVKSGVKILIKMPFQDKVFNVKARVAHCEKSLESKLYDLGVNFYRVKDAFKIKLIEQLYLISEFRDLWSMQLGKEVSLEDASREWIKRYSERFSKMYW
ncbi:MAG: PilZ domain-containing protein [Candidatus Omnitrophota bacterium]|nr:PilZ domain-containing protein [Candidatus Omnitrophota bacterium]